MRALKVLVVGMGVLIVAASVALVVMIVQRAGKAIPTAPSGPPVEMSLGQPAGSRIGGIASGAEGRVAVWVQRADGDRLLIVDTRSGRALGEIRLGE
ncbi:DUF6476 family protein [Roseomonas xinghualingensis]|uniref:DUF6476 family protein n=1 Tax=Roseomonas xinghualingensis TaxID=2986475 RepID=UPI0021F1999B|nr:DUF6476 family protein [Roseomonas sp. SXEYE001]MCV4206962.1 DUF6476 family protein [Roseomonas sp. SXEYE001]